jgi:predicted CxxxxCH...CXXCH cytochrome family protein
MSGQGSHSTRTVVYLAILISSIALLSACGEPRPAASQAPGGGASGGSKTCTLCHGDGTRQSTLTNPQLPASPPKGTKGETATSARAVGAHQLHLQDGSLRPAVACTECHVVPTTAGHATGKVELTFGPLATNGGALPQWNGSSCSASYCHGGFVGGDSTNAPVWTQARPASCGTCHGLPPASPHPTVSTGANCGDCHPGYTATTVNLASHMNGKVEVDGLSCASCHGDATRTDTALNPQFSAAPPKGSKGETATSSRAVGAHALHLKDGNATACTECHVVPTSFSHPDGKADVAFGTMARTGGASPSWSGATCSNVYCHGAFTGGNVSYAPWQ